MLLPIRFNELKKKDLLRIVAYFIHAVYKSFIPLEGNRFVQSFINNIVYVLKKEEAFAEILNIQISILVEEGILTPVPEDSEYQNPFNTTRKLERNFYEDENVAHQFFEWRKSSDNDINLVRVVCYTGNSGIIKTMLALFFSKDYSLLNHWDGALPKKISKLVYSYEDVAFLKKALDLSEEEAVLLQAAFRYETNRLLNRALSDEMDHFCVAKNLAAMTGIREDKINFCLRKGEKLVDFGFLNGDGTMNDDVVNTIREQNIDAYFTDVLRKVDVKDAFDMDSFNISEKSKDNLDFFLTGEDSANILFYGKPGSGKSELSKALAKQYGMNAFVYKNETELSDSENKNPGYHSLARLNCLLSIKKPNTLIIVDEAETVLKTMDFGNRSLAQKGTVNQILDKNLNHVLWILNYTDQLDESTKRRMNYSIKFEGMSVESMKMIAASELSKIDLTPFLHKKILELFNKYKVTGASIKNIVKAVKSAASKSEMTKSMEKKLLFLVEDILESNSTLIYGKNKTRDVVGNGYSETVLNTTISSDKIVRMVQNAAKFDKQNNNSQNGIRMLFHGVSGSGKTEFCRYIAQKLGKKLLVKRASDILGMYVGESEKNIRDAFAEAESSDSILLFDEADSFIAGRNNASRSWERTLVNEFLSQLDEFNGICICNTNLKEIVDSAMFRRFNIITEFKPLAEDGIRTLLNNYFGNYQFSEEQLDSIASYNSVTPGDFSTLYNRIRFMESSEVCSDFITEELCNLQKEKSNSGEKVMGFCA